MILHTKKKQYKLNERSHVMGILNVTPDSFSDGGSYTELDMAVEQAGKLVTEGADFIDVGGESTRPNHTPVSIEEEIERVVPVIQAVKSGIETPISIDTYKARTADAAIEAGAEIINDVWGAKYDPEIADLAAERGVPIILMHNRSHKHYDSIIDDMKREMTESVDIALKAGVEEENIILDPGVGFGKTLSDNYVVLNNLEKFHDLGYPLLLGTSRKSFIKETIDIPARDRDVATGATTCLGITKGVQIFRVHDVATNKHLSLMMDAMLKA